MITYNAVVFDMDGVLFDTETVSAIYWLQVGAQMHLDDIADTLKQCTGTTVPTMRAFFAQRYGADFPFDDFLTETRTRYHEALDRDGVKLMPGVREMLTFLKESGKKIAIASSSTRSVIVHYLDQHGLQPWFDAIVSGDSVQNGKPNPEIYLKACAMLGEAPENCIAVEDSHNGIRAAHAAGMKAVMVPDTIEPTDEIRALTYAIRDSLLDLRDLLAQRDAPERWDAYDAQGVCTGETLLRGAPVPEGRYHAVAATFVRHRDGDFLFMQRDARKTGCPGLWECGGCGGVQQGETIDAGARREVAEETGLTGGTWRKLSQRVEGKTIFAHYLMITDAPKDAVRLQPGETAAYRWVRAADVADFVRSPACVPFLAERFAQFAEDLQP